MLGQVAGISKTCSIEQGIGEEYRVFSCKGVQVFDDERIKADYNFQLKIFDCCIFISRV
jgi:hypothetical protein